MDLISLLGLSVAFDFAGDVNDDLVSSQDAGAQGCQCGDGGDEELHDGLLRGCWSEFR